jgi:hypothetical protein
MVTIEKLGPRKFKFSAEAEDYDKDPRIITNAVNGHEYNLGRGYHVKKWWSYPIARRGRNVSKAGISLTIEYVK